MAAIDRRAALCDQSRFTGIDVVQVVDPTTQDVVRVFFVVDPSTLETPMVARGDLQPAGTAVPAPGLGLTLTSLEDGEALEITRVVWRLVPAPSGERLALEVTLPAPGGFERHRLTLRAAAVDPFFASVDFSFKQACPQDFDCRADRRPAAADGVDAPIDDLDRDFWSLRCALLDFYQSRYPRWSRALVADQVVMLTEIMAALGDAFAYTQDRYAREAALATATQRRSRKALARLVDYTPDPGHDATTELVVRVASGGEYAPIGARVFALPQGRAPVAFAVEERIWHPAAWNEIALYQPDSAERCLPAGATTAFLATASPTVGELRPDTTLGPTAYWRGRRAILRARPTDPSEPERAVAVTLTEATRLTDELTTPPTELVRIRWAEPTPWPLPYDGTTASLNVVKVRAGDRVVERFRVGPDAAIDARFPTLGFEERRDDVARPHAVTRWTGSLSTDLVAADPTGGSAPTSAQLRAFDEVVDCVRQAGRDARVGPSDYLDIDLEIEVCVAAEAYPGGVVPPVEHARTAPGFFSPDNFTFGQALRRSALEAAIRRVPGGGRRSRRCGCACAASAPGSPSPTPRSRSSPARSSACRTIPRCPPAAACGSRAAEVRRAPPHGSKLRLPIARSSAPAGHPRGTLEPGAAPARGLSRVPRGAARSDRRACGARRLAGARRG